MHGHVADARRAGSDRARAAFRDQQRVPRGELVFLLVDQRRAPSFEHDEQDIKLGGGVLRDLVAGGPDQERRVQVAAGHPPERAGAVRLE